MKRGRPSARLEIQKEILEVLSTTSIPITISSITKEISRKLGRKISWNTVQKYIEELVTIDKVLPTPLPHSKKAGETGLVVYRLKR